MANDIVAELVQELQDARTEMLAVVNAIGQKTQVAPGWEIKELMAHIAGWDEVTLASLRAHRDGGLFEIPAFEGIDQFNEYSVAKRQNLKYEQVFKEWQTLRSELKRELRELPVERLKSEMRYPWGSQGSVVGLINIMAHHEREHCAAIRKLLASEE